MEIISDITAFTPEKRTAVAIGKFDGIHVGHRQLLSEILEKKKDGYAACIFTFDPPPSVLFGFSDGKELTTKEEKRAFFSKAGIDLLVEYPLTRESAATSPEDFVTEILVKRLNVGFVVAGDDLSFGDKGRGDEALLRSFSREYDFQVKTISKVLTRDRVPVSSSLLRSLVEEAKMEQVEELLEQPYSVTETIVHGNHMGHGLGFPTINQVPDDSKLLPPFGVYTSLVEVDGVFFHGLSNIGRKPTIEGTRPAGVETFLYDFDGDLYGKTATVYLKHFCRPEKTFGSLEELKKQLRSDITAHRP